MFARLEISTHLARAAAFAVLACALTGCPHQVATTTDEFETQPGASASLAERIDSALAFTRDQRTLSLEEHAAWQILHGALAFEQDFQVMREGQPVSAVKHLLKGGEMNGWTVELVERDGDERPGLRAILEAGTKTGQGHADQWLAVLSQCDLSAETPLVVNDTELTMRDFVKQVQADVPRNLKREFSWTLIGLTGYLPTDAEWTANDGKTWSIEKLIEIESEQELASSACGGTHRVIGLAMSLNRHRKQGGSMNGPWIAANDVIQQAIINAKRYQNPDGSFSTSYFSAPGASPDLAQNLGATGHIVEFLAIAMDDEQIEEPWVRNAVAYLCSVFEKTKEVPLECGALYHAAHGLALYRERIN